MNFTRTSISIALILLTSWLAPIAQAQAAKDDSDPQLQDDLLDHFVGQWEVSAVVYGTKFTLQREAEWVLNHQFLRVHEKSREIVPWLKIPFERTVYIGYNPRLKHYVFHEMSVHGANLPFAPEGFSYGIRTANELIVEHMNGAERFGTARWSWDPATSTWHIYGSRMKDGKEELFLHHAAVAAKPGSR